jgi:ATP-dependent RNA helicase HelY
MTNPKYHSRRPFGKSRERKHGGKVKDFYEKPRLDPLLKQSFKKIGRPDPTPFRPDPFQLDALDKIQNADVLVTAPTGSGKTWIASQTIAQYLHKELRTWYASPLKALSNSIYLEFSKEFGPHACGIITGERRENTGASVIVGTTEILRNQLYDAMHQGARIDADLVIIDEAHYLSDPDRGVVWEEVLIYLPARVRLLLLSATISNAEEICAWLQENRGTEIHVVRSIERPVPLDLIFLFPDGLIAPLSGKKGLTPKVKKFLSSEPMRGKKRGPGRPRFGDIIKILRRFNLLPVIFFLKSRIDCDKAIFTCLPSDRSDDMKSHITEEVRAFLHEYPHLQGHRQIGPLLDALVASHHAGQLPYWKVLIERMMNKGYLDAIFSTSTVAAGVNFPARTVVLVQSDRFNGHEFSDLTATDLHQMIGRAGRRGKDNIGFVLILPGLHQDPQLIDELKDASPEPLMSQIRINFSMTLNLLLSHTPLIVKDLLDHSFAAFQQKSKGSIVERQWHEMSLSLMRLLPAGQCDTSDPYDILENIQKRSELRKEKRAFSKNAHYERMRQFLVPGRIFLHHNKEKYVLFDIYDEYGKSVCRAHNIEKPIRVKKERIRLKKIPLEKIRLLYHQVVELPEHHSPESLQATLDATTVDQLEILDLDAGTKNRQTNRQTAIDAEIKALPCETCEHLKDCHSKKRKDLSKLLGNLLSMADRMEITGEGLWISFKRHLRFLRETGFVDENDRLTHDGVWASKLRLDQPLLIAEAIRKGSFKGVSAEVMAGLLAPFVWDRGLDMDVRVGDRLKLRELEDALERLVESITDIRNRKARRRFETPPVFIWPAYALFLWATSVPWEELLFQVPVSDGDMASLIVRTADHLRQICNLKETHPQLAATAEKAIARILREPVFIE